MKHNSFYQKAYFLLSAADVKQLPPDQGIEIAIVGRSNAGKSSVLNRITQSKNLARVSKTPGRTQMINVFILDETHRLIDLPGYGYAKAPPALQQQWQKTVDIYFNTRDSLKGLILVMDIRHPLQPLDKQLLTYCAKYQMPVHIVLNKTDKLSKNIITKTVEMMKTSLTHYSNSVTFQCFSALRCVGLEELHTALDRLYDHHSS